MGSESTSSLEEIRGDRGRQPQPGRRRWVAVRVRQLAAAAQSTPARNLFPYDSLHFSRCSHYPFTHDCPWILFDREPCFVAYAPHPTGVQGNLALPLPPVLLDTDDSDAAIAAVVQARPPHYGTVWIGSVESQP